MLLSLSRYPCHARPSSIRNAQAAISAAKRASSQAAVPAFNPVYQGGSISSTTAATASAGTSDGTATARTTRDGEKQGEQGGVVAPVVSQEEAAAAAGDSEDDDDVDWEEQEVEQGGDGLGVLGAGRQAVVDSDGDEGAGCLSCSLLAESGDGDGLPWFLSFTHVVAVRDGFCFISNLCRVFSASDFVL